MSGECVTGPDRDEITEILFRHQPILYQLVRFRHHMRHIRHVKVPNI